MYRKGDVGFEMMTAKAECSASWNSSTLQWSRRAVWRKACWWGSSRSVDRCESEVSIKTKVKSMFIGYITTPMFGG